MAYTAQQPPAHNDTYVKATSYVNANYIPPNGTDPTHYIAPGSGAWSDQCWLTTTTSNQRFHIDLGSGKIIRQVSHRVVNGSPFNTAKNYTLWGSDSGTSFAELTYGTDTGWTQIGSYQFSIGGGVNGVDDVNPYYQAITNSTSYRYYAFKIADSWAPAGYLAIYNLTLYTEDGYSPGGGGVLTVNYEGGVASGVKVTQI